jgi:hypothetical protein
VKKKVAAMDSFSFSVLSTTEGEYVLVEQLLYFV